MKLGTYIPAFIDSCNDMVERSKLLGSSDGRTDFEDSIGGFRDFIKSGVPYLITEQAVDFIKNTDCPDNILEGTRLPYPEIVIEWYAGDTYSDSIESHEIISSERLIHMIDIDVMRDLLTIPKDVALPDGFIISAMFKGRDKTGDLGWAINSGSIIVPYSALSDTSKWKDVKNNKLHCSVLESGHNIENVAEDEITLIASCPMYHDRWDGNHPMQQEALRNMSEELQMALGLLSIFSCDNAPTTVKLPSKLSNQRRKKNKKSLIPSYRTLHISSHTVRSSESNPAKSERIGVRAHWRRGHIRNQPTAKGIIRKWIKPMIVSGKTAPKPELVLT
jgi:hypothetical protein